MFQFHNTTDAERKRMASQTSILPTSDARAYGMTTARTANGGRKFPRTTCRELTSDCVVTRANGDVFTIKAGTRPRKDKSATVKAVVKRDNARDYTERLAMFGATGDVN